MISGAWLAHFVETQPKRARARFWVAEHEGRVVGWAEAIFNWTQERTDAATVWAGVAASHRNSGVGGALFSAAEAYALEGGATALRSEAERDSDGSAFLRARSFEQVREEVFSAVEPPRFDLSQLTALEAQRVVEGFRLSPLGEVLDRPRELFELYAAAEADVPSDNPHTGPRFEEFMEQWLGSPLLDLEGSFVVLDGDRPVSLAWILSDREGAVAVHDMTGTLREYRRRGLARLCKLATIRWAAENGIERLMTSNDYENEAMLGLNRQLGYRPFVTWTKFAKETGAD